MIYKDYEAQITYSEEDEIFVGRVVNVEFDIIAFDGTSISELKQAFKTVVDDYLQDCADMNKKPEQPQFAKLAA